VAMLSLSWLSLCSCHHRSWLLSVSLSSVEWFRFRAGGCSVGGRCAACWGIAAGDDCCMRVSNGGCCCHGWFCCGGGVVAPRKEGMSRGNMTVHKSAIAVVVVVVGVVVMLSLLLQGVREGVGKAKLSHILPMSSFSCWRSCRCGGRAMEM